MESFTQEEISILKIAIKEFAGITSNFGHSRAAQFELDKNEEKALSSLIEKFEVDLDDDEMFN
jgi:hypothetical protein